MVDRLLVARCRQGNRDALRRIYEKYRDDLLIMAIALSHDVHLAEDAVHDVFVAFARNVRHFKLTGSLKAYLARCVINRIRDLMRMRRSQARVLEAERVCPEPKDANDPSDLIVCSEELRLLSKALSELPDEQREVIVLRMQGQMRFRKIAQLMDISVNTVKGRYRYGIQKLRSILNSENEQ
ncbi:MAG: RNA polymerase sigma factor [Sedimentisphaerales bacterium]|nr:RNA polymerase sigma factor [Sedimentisphaerales bacterium]